jgi:hypothetical protein
MRGDQASDRRTAIAAAIISAASLSMADLR